MDITKTHATDTPTTRRVAVAPLLLTVGLGAVACGSTEAPPAATPLATPEAFESAWASARCEQITRCGELPGEDALSAGNLRNRAACLRIIGGSTGGPERVARGVVRYDAAAARRCVEQQRATCPIPGIQDIGSCREVYVGTRAVGAACTLDVECLPGNTCERTGACSGICRPAAARGAPCGTPDTSFACAHPAGGTARCGTFDRTGAPSVCNHYRAGPAALQGTLCGVTPGASANEFVVTPCATGLGCALNTPLTGTCRPLAAPGAPCGAGGVICEAGSTCSARTAPFVCQAAAVRAAAGEACGGRGGAVCDPATLFCTDDGTGVCAVAGAGREGSRCTPGAFGDVACAPGLACAEATSTCVRPAADGQPCRRGADCASGSCEGSMNVCQPRCG